jgi:hypothetical protein
MIRRERPAGCSCSRQMIGSRCFVRSLPIRLNIGFLAKQRLHLRCRNTTIIWRRRACSRLGAHRKISYAASVRIPAHEWETGQLGDGTKFSTLDVTARTYEAIHGISRSQQHHGTGAEVFHHVCRFRGRRSRHAVRRGDGGVTRNESDECFSNSCLTNEH